MSHNIDEFIRSFMYFYRLLGKNQDRFFEQFMREISNLKENEDIQSNNFIQILKEELIHLQEKEIKENSPEQNLQSIPVQEQEKNTMERVQENDFSNISSSLKIDIPHQYENNENLALNSLQPSISDKTKTFILPFNGAHFEFILTKNTNEFIEKANIDLNQKLEDLKIVKNIEFEGNDLKLFAKDILLSEDKKQSLRVEYAKSYLKKLGDDLSIDMKFLGFNNKGEILLEARSDMNQSNFLELVNRSQKNIQQAIDSTFQWNFDWDQIQKYQKESQDYINTFTTELKELENNQQELLNTQNIDSITNVQNKEEDQKNKFEIKENKSENVASLLNFFEKMKIEHENMAIGKDHFKKEFLIYSKTQMKENEMIILLKLLDKNPTRLTKEHQEMIQKGLAYNLMNPNLLDKNLQITIKTHLKHQLTTEEKQHIADKQKTIKPTKQELSVKEEIKSNPQDNIKSKSSKKAQTPKIQTPKKDKKSSKDFGMSM